MPGEMIIDRLIRSRRRTLSLEITPDGKLTVRAPLRASLLWIRQVIRNKESWIIKKQRQMQSRWQEKIARRFTPGEYFLFRGELYPLDFVADSDRPLKWENDRFRLHFLFRENGRELIRKWYQARAEEHLRKEVDHYSRLTGLSPCRVRISWGTKRWGSCSPRGDLYFNWRLIMAPPPVLRYVVIHEIAHLAVRNHSPLFWKEVEKWMPDYQTHRLWLREHGSTLELE